MPDKNYGQLRYGNSDGELRFGFIDELQNKHAFLVRSGSSPSHYFSMISSTDGDAKTNSYIDGGTVLRSPGALQIDAGKKVDPGLLGVFIDANNGELVLSSKSNVRIQGKNIILVAQGADETDSKGNKTSNGNILIEADEKLLLSGKQGVKIKSAATLEVVSSNTVRIIADGILKIFGNMIEFADGASSTLTKKSKVLGIEDPTGAIGSSFETEMSLRGKA